MDGLAALERKTVLVHTKDGQSFRGAMRAWDDCVSLANAATWNGEQEVSLEGEAWIPLSNISWFQTLGGVS